MLRPNELADESSGLGSYDATDGVPSGYTLVAWHFDIPPADDDYLCIETRYGAGIDRAQPYSLA